MRDLSCVHGPLCARGGSSEISRIFSCRLVCLVHTGRSEHIRSRVSEARPARDLLSLVSHFQELHPSFLSHSAKAGTTQKI